MRSWRAALAAGCLAWLGLTGCAGSVYQASSQPDVVTASDEAPEHRRARIRTDLASGYLQRGQAEVALDEVKLALQAAGDYAPAHQVKGLAYMALEQPALAKVSFDAAMKLTPLDPDLLHNIGWWHCAARDYAQADLWFDRALDQGAGSRSWLGKALCAQRGRNAQAEDYFSRAYALAPRDPQVVMAWAMFASERSRWSQVHALLDPFNSTELVSAQSLWMQAKALHHMGESEQARNVGQRLSTDFAVSAQAKAYERKLWNE